MDRAIYAVENGIISWKAIKSLLEAGLGFDEAVDRAIENASEGKFKNFDEWVADFVEN